MLVYEWLSSLYSQELNLFLHRTGLNINWNLSLIKTGQKIIGIVMGQPQFSALLLQVITVSVSSHLEHVFPAFCPI